MSCRDAAATADARRRYSFREAVFSGWAEDGGMLMPERIPRIPRDTLDAWRQRTTALTYPECCFAVLRITLLGSSCTDAGSEHFYRL